MTVLAPTDVLAAGPEDYRQHIGRSHGVRVRVLASVNGSAFSLEVPYQRGSGVVSVAPGTGVARSLACRVQAWPDDGLVDPFAVEWQAQYGLTIGRQTTWVPVGTFCLTEVKEVGPGLLDVKAMDRWLRVADARFEQRKVTSGNTVTALSTLLQEADGRITVDTSAAPTGTHRSSVWDRDRDKAVQALARSIGAQVRFSPSGVAVISPVPALGDDPFLVIGRGRGGAKVRSLGGMTTRRTYNAVVVIGEKPGGDPIYAVARDTSTSSRTRYGGLAGKRPRFYTSDLITTQAQASAAAVALLGQSLRVSRTLEVEALPHPGLDAGHVLDVEVRASEWERHLTGPFDLPLGPGTVTISAASTAEGDDDA